MSDSLKGKTAFVAGATGLTGRHVTRILAERGAKVFAHVRSDSNKGDEWKTRLEELGAQVDRTPWNDEAMTKTIERIRPDAVFALLGTTRTRQKKDRAVGQDSSYEAVDYGLSAQLRRACEASGCKPRFVYLSAIGVSDSSGNPYYQVRARVERELREGSIPYVIARPAFIIGDRDEHRAAEKTFAELGDALLDVAGVFGARKLRDRYRSLTGAQLAAGLVRIAFDPNSTGKIVEPDGLRA